MTSRLTLRLIPPVLLRKVESLVDGFGEQPA